MPAQDENSKWDTNSKDLTPFSLWYNRFRPHMTIGGRVPDAVFQTRPFRKPERTDKTVPANISRRVFDEARVTAYSLEDCA